MHTEPVPLSDLISGPVGASGRPSTSIRSSRPSTDLTSGTLRSLVLKPKQTCDFAAKLHSGQNSCEGLTNVPFEAMNALVREQL